MGIRVSDDLETGLDEEPGIKEHQEQLSVHRNLLFVRSLEDLRLYTVIKEAHKAGLRVWVDIDGMKGDPFGHDQPRAPYDIQAILKQLDGLAEADESNIDDFDACDIATLSARVIRYLVPYWTELSRSKIESSYAGGEQQSTNSYPPRDLKALLEQLETDGSDLANEAARVIRHLARTR